MLFYFSCQALRKEHTRYIIYLFNRSFFYPEAKDICNKSECRTCPLRRFSQSSQQLHRSSNMLSTFCTGHNVQECVSHINQVGNFLFVFYVV